MKSAYLVTIEADDRGVTEEGWNLLCDAIEDADLEGRLRDAAIDAIRELLPRDFPDAFTVRVDESR